MKKHSMRMLGGRTGAVNERQKDDYYATDPIALELLLEQESFNENILEPACGEGHLSKVLKDNNYNVTSSDLIDRGYGEVKDFFSITDWNGDIITNPPFKHSLEFVTHSLKIIKNGQKIAMFLKIQFLESLARKEFFSNYPPSKVYVFHKRMKCAMNGNFAKHKSSSMMFAWFIWEKGKKNTPTIHWLG